MGAFIDNEVVGTPHHVPPYSHAAGYEACDRTDLVAGTDVRSDVLAAFGARYGVSEEHLYTDYKELIEKEQPDILSIATQPEQRAEIAIYAAEHGVKALYCEKAMCASLPEADAMVEAVERNGVAFNMGTNRRWHPGFDAMREVIASGRLGALKSLIIYSNGTLFNTSSHTFDLMQRLNGDAAATWVQGHLPQGDELIVGDELRDDPAAEGMFGFENGVTVYAMSSPRASEYEAICESGVLTALNNGVEFRMRKVRAYQVSARTIRDLSDDTFPEYERASSTLRLVEDLVAALDRGDATTRGGVRVARANMELIFGFVESHRRGGARVTLPLDDPGIRLVRHDREARQPRFEPATA
ncbi:MAG: hypothetical protein CMN65_07575 [Sphingomonadaceae bacterium]|nr:hypothetical protein [Sphingomonadaceae bacterium]